MINNKNVLIIIMFISACNNAIENNKNVGKKKRTKEKLNFYKIKESNYKFDSTTFNYDSNYTVEICEFPFTITNQKY